jgi:hypothetical protein
MHRTCYLPRSRPGILTCGHSDQPHAQQQQGVHRTRAMGPALSPVADTISALGSGNAIGVPPCSGSTWAMRTAPAWKCESIFV